MALDRPVKKDLAMSGEVTPGTRLWAWRVVASQPTPA